MDQKPKFPKPVKAFTVPIYGGTVLVYHDYKKLHLADAIATGHTDVDNTQPGGECIDQQTPFPQYLLGVYDNEAITLIHEVCHLTFFILRNAGVDPMEGNNEAYAYLHSALMVEYSKCKSNRMYFVNDKGERI